MSRTVYVTDGPQTATATSRWWTEKDPGPAMVDAAQAIWDSPSERIRRQMALIYARLHSGRPLASLYDFGSAMRAAYVNDPFGGRIPINLVQSVIESIAAKIAKNKPRPLVLTEGGNWSLQRQAKNLTKYVDGLNDASGTYKIGRRIFKDSGAFGTGIFLPYTDDDAATVGVDRILPTECFVDEAEAVYGKPQTVYLRRHVYRGKLADMFPDKRELIASAKGESPIEADGRASEMIPVFEAWTLAGGGGHVIAIEEGTLSNDDWKFPWHPQVFFRWREPETGIWGIGAAENLLGLQKEVKQLMERIRQAMHLVAVPRIFVKPGAQLSKSKLTNETGIIVEAEDVPTFHPGVTVPPETFQHLWNLYAKAFEIEGVSQLAATGNKPAGLNSGEALRTHHDIESERFVLLGQDWEDAHVELAEKQIALSKSLYKRGKSVTVKAPGTKFIESLDFSKVNMEENRYTIRTYPVSILPTTPAGKLQKIQELYEGGLIPDRETALSLLDFPDLDSALSLSLAAIDDIKRILEAIEEDGRKGYEPPEEFMNLDLALRMAQSRYLRGRSEKMPEDRLDLLARFMDEVRELQKEVTPPPAPPAPPPVDPNAQLMAPGSVPAPGLPPALPPGMDSGALPSQVPA